MSGQRVEVLRCSMCGVELPAQARRHNTHYCKACRKIYNASYWARRRGEEPGRVCVVCGKEKVLRSFAGPDGTCRKCAYLARIRRPGWELRKEGKRPEGNHGGLPVQAERREEMEPGPWAVATRTEGCVPVLRGEHHGGVRMWWMSDGVEETALFVGARDAVAAWNTGQVSSVSGCKQPGQVSRAAEMDRARLEERARSGELNPVTIVSAGVQAECSTLGVGVKES